MSTVKAPDSESAFITLIGIAMIFGYYYIDSGYDPIDAYFYGDAGHIFFGILCALVAYVLSRD
jgi:hypothetical protein